MGSLLIVGLAIIVYTALRGKRRQSPSRTTRPSGTGSRSPASGRDGRDPAGPVAGWLLGHQIARGHHGFPGDPLPGGHLGSPANLAFWGGMFDEESDSEPDRDSDEDEWEN